MNVSDNILPASHNENGVSTFFQKFLQNLGKHLYVYMASSSQHHNIKMNVHTYVCTVYECIYLSHYCYTPSLPTGFSLNFFPTPHKFEKLNISCHLFIWRPENIHNITASRAKHFYIARICVNIRKDQSKCNCSKMILKIIYIFSNFYRRLD